MKKDLDTWLSEYSNANTRRAFGNRVKKFLEWSKLSTKELRELEPEEITHKLHVFQNDILEDGHSKNTTRNYVNATKLYLEFCGIALPRLKPVTANRRPKRKYHDFSNGDLMGMFEIGSTHSKALITTLSSTGWSIDDVLSMDKEFIKSKIKRARANGDNFVFYEDTRQKSGALALCILNPLAIEWLEKWINMNENEKLFPLTYDAYQYRLSELFKKAVKNATGRFRIHNIRKWTINSLIKAGFNTEEWKYIVGKSVDSSDETYLRLKPIIKEKYPKHYQKYLSLQPSSVVVKTKDEHIEKLENALIEAEKDRNTMKTRLETMTKKFDKAMTLLEDHNIAFKEFASMLPTLRTMVKKKQVKDKWKKEGVS